jgi:hypothetical protein
MRLVVNGQTGVESGLYSDSSLACGDSNGPHGAFFVTVVQADVAKASPGDAFICASAGMAVSGIRNR